MRIIKEIWGRVMASWAMLVFVITMLPVIVAMCFIALQKDPQRTVSFCRVTRLWMTVFFFLTGCRLKIKGDENFKPGENYVVICNHNSMMDIPVATPFIPGANKTIAKIEMANVPLFGMIYRIGSVLVDRKDKDSRRESFVKMKAVLDMGIHMCIYPEGTRNKTKDPLKEFHNGAFRLAIETGKPILPALIFNTTKALPVNKTFFFRPTTMEFHFLPAVYTSPDDDHEMLKQRLFGLMSNYYVSVSKPVIK